MKEILLVFEGPVRSRFSYQRVDNDEVEWPLASDSGAGGIHSDCLDYSLQKINQCFQTGTDLPSPPARCSCYATLKKPFILNPRVNINELGYLSVENVFMASCVVSMPFT